MSTLTLLAGFVLVALASHRIGGWCTRVGLPYITGYLATGALAGGFVLDLLPSAAPTQLRFVDEVSLGVIAFIAGSELYLPDLRGRLRTIGAMAASITVIAALVIGLTLFALTGWLSFTADLDVPARVAVALLGAAVLLALSPPSTIAVIKEIGARGPFTATALSITVVMDVVVVVAFAAAASIAAALVHATGLDLAFVGVLAADLAIAVVAGVALGKGLGWVLARRLPVLGSALVVLAAGFGVYELAELVDTWSRENLPFELYIEPLLLTMVAGFTVTNLTDRRDDFEEVLHRVAPTVYVAFFTLTGVGLELDTLLAVLPAALLLFAVRIAAIAAGSRVGARLAGQTGPVATRSWMALVTQAGIALGLAREAGVQFPELGAAFTTLVIAVVVLNEVLGPSFLKHVLTRVGETRGESRQVAIVGIDRNAKALHDRLVADGWGVVLADGHAGHVDEVRGGGRTAVRLAPSPVRTLEELEELPDTLVAMSGDDHDNLAICRAAVEAGITRTVARVTDPALLPDFHDLGTLVVDPTRAAVTLLEEAVRTPDATGLVLHADVTRDTREITVTAVARGGRELRDLRLPQDVLVLTVRRGDATLVPDGFTRVRRGDVLTLVGAPDALRETAARLGS
jgi:Trk K+ transport system NAD-binding subunit/Kef-type K+ transport system membrane component KefB